MNETKRLYYQYLGFINTSSLLKQNIINIEQFYLEKNTIDYDTFKNLQLNEQLPLGKRIEFFFELYLNNTNKYNILYKNLQINHDKLTIGEFDFIIENIQTKQILHIELVYKFYIYLENSDEIKRYIGPNNHDSLEDKLNKLKTKQFPLLYNNLTKEKLNTLNIKDIKQKLCFLGNIFIPSTINANFKNINQECISGSYIDFNEFIKNVKYKTYQYILPQKQDWIIDPKYFENWNCYDDILHKINQHFSRNISAFIYMKNDSYFFKIFILQNRYISSSICV